MSKFTTEVRFICESKSGLEESKGFNNIETIISNSVTHIFNFDFPIFDENYRIPLEKKILRHYYTREISEETVGLWQLRLCQKLNEIMPYYNKLYSSELLNFNPLNDVDLTTTHQRTNNGETSKIVTTRETTDIDRNNDNNITRNKTGSDNLTNTHNDTTQLANAHDDTTTLTNTHNDTNNNTQWDVYSDTPQGALTNVDNNTYLTNARKITENKANTGGYTDTTSNRGAYTNQSTNTGGYTDAKTLTERETIENTTDNTEDITKNGTINDAGTTENTEDYIQRIIGKTANKSYSKLVLEFRETFLNIDAMILKDLSVCFFGLWE